ncbi:MAG: DUF6308 family protein [Cellulomonas sp.]|nr:DUF6308 family protein [Cellulomonas sp.]MCR6704854.1 DUF6308 family protein [Cellulomonas sp.]
MSVVRVGGRSWSSDEASAFVKRYLTTPRENWAYPAYDAYPGAPTDLVGPQDLFAPELLNAGLSLRAYYAFLDALEEVNERLAHVPTAVDLATAKPDDIAAVAHVIGVLDHPRIAGVKLTKLSKVLHRKRPRIFPSTTSTSGGATRMGRALRFLRRRTACGSRSRRCGWRPYALICRRRPSAGKSLRR